MFKKKEPIKKVAWILCSKDSNKTHKTRYEIYGMASKYLHAFTGSENRLSLGFYPSSQTPSDSVHLTSIKNAHINDNASHHNSIKFLVENQ